MEPNEEIKKRVDQLEFFKRNPIEPHSPITNKRRVSKKYQAIVEDYIEISKRYNQLLEIQKLSTEIIIEFSNKYEELDTDKIKMFDQLTKTMRLSQSQKEDQLELISKLGVHFKELYLICEMARGGE